MYIKYKGRVIKATWSW